MYEQAFSPDKENDERSFDEICDEALKLFKSQCDNIHFKAIDDSTPIIRHKVNN